MFWKKMSFFTILLNEQRLDPSAVQVTLRHTRLHVIRHLPRCRTRCQKSCIFTISCIQQKAVKTVCWLAKFKRKIYKLLKKTRIFFLQQLTSKKQKYFDLGLIFSKTSRGVGSLKLIGSDWERKIWFFCYSFIALTFHLSAEAKF